jgi:hypothetical protein
MKKMRLRLRVINGFKIGHFHLNSQGIYMSSYIFKVENAGYVHA